MAMIPNDARLCDLTFLLVAGQRALARREAAGGPEPAWLQGEGLASLLKAGQALPQRDPWAMPDLTTPMGRMLAEAQAWLKEHGHDPQ